MSLDNFLRKPTIKEGKSKTWFKSEVEISDAIHEAVRCLLSIGCVSSEFIRHAAACRQLLSFLTFKNLKKQEPS